MISEEHDANGEAVSARLAARSAESASARPSRYAWTERAEESLLHLMLCKAGFVNEKRDLAAFEQRARRYDEGWLGRFHHDIAQRVATIADSFVPHPNRVLDVGCGSGYLLGLMAERNPAIQRLDGVDASRAMVDVARSITSDSRIEVREGIAEQLPFEDRLFDLVISTTSFDHWSDQAAGLHECARVLSPDGILVIADLFSPVLVATLFGDRREKARTRRRAERLSSAAGLQVDAWHKVHTLIQAFVARPRPAT